MNHLLRLTWLLITAPFRRRLDDMFEESVLRLRVWPTDLDIQMHMNNGIYLSLLDLGRIDLLLKSRAYFKLTKAGFYPVVASEAIRFRRSLKVFRTFEIRTRMAGWDEKYFYIRQDFSRNGEICASALIKGCFLRRGADRKTGAHRVSAEEMFVALGMEPKGNRKEKSAELLDALEENLNN